MVEQIFENDVSVCVEGFMKDLSDGEKNSLDRTDIVTRETINKILVSYEKTSAGFFDEMTELDHSINNRIIGNKTVFLAEMFKKDTLKIPSKWGDKNEVARTLLSLVAETEASHLRKEQVLFRDAKNLKSPQALERVQQINRLTSFQSNLMQPKTPPLSERPGMMQV